MTTETTLDIKEFEVLFRTYYAELCGFANQYLQDIDDAEEIVQSFFVKFWEGRAKMTAEKRNKSYLYKSVKNACLNQIKHIKIRETYKTVNEREMKDGNNTVLAEVEGNELDDKIRTSIENLPEGRRKIFIMSRYEGLKYKEIAEELKISIKTVENQMGAAIKYLRTELSEYLISILIFLQLL
ncbi:RNA polymerase sigma-70 factor [Putridiphycobacter roseus]|uniref:RNA polymerase sigma-70 factor n=1 Tax=Putridiphycobacter roseus TaxID=2219161 RepID=UPI0018F16F62|nr:RNA polymerase sigma-70 factor [Putridiphycobacter roseus]